MLLISPDIPSTSAPQYSWGLICGKKANAESAEQTILRKIKNTTKLELKNIKLLLSKQNSDDYIYHGELSDSDVNGMERREGERLEFYTMTELKKLTLAHNAEGLLSEYKETVEELLAH